MTNDNTAIDTAIEALDAARVEVRAMPLEDAQTAVFRLHERVWRIDEDNRQRDRK
jgi:uncharacterized membrane protein